MDNNGEGGTLSLTALAFRAVGRRSVVVLTLGVIGAAMFYGSSLITPALSVLSAVEGLEGRDAGVRALRAADYDRAPGRAVRGAVARHRQSFGAVRPDHGRSGSSSSCSSARCTLPTIPACWRRSIRTMRSPLSPSNGMIGLITLGAVFLVVTGSEALYADLGHFGRKPIQTAWFYLVLPALLINYFGQGALVLANPGGDRESVLSTRSHAGYFPAADGRVGDDGDRHCEPGGHHRRLFDHPPGDPAWTAAAVRDPPYLGGAVRADLHAAREHPAAGRRAAAGRIVPDLERSRRRLCPCGGGDQPDGDAASLSS